MNMRFCRCAIAAAVAACALPLRAELVSWNVDANGSWTLASNWSTNALPSPTSDVTIDRPAGDFIVTLSSGTQNINSLFLAEQLTVNSGVTLSVATAFQINNTFTLDGTLRTATVSVGPGGQFNLVSATLDAVKLNNDLSVTNDTLSLLNGLTLNGGILRLIENAGSAGVSLSNSQTIGGTGTLFFDGITATGPALVGAFTLTLAPGITTKTGTGHGAITTAGLVNQGVLSSETAGRTVSISSSFFQNAGTLQTVNGGAFLITTPTLTIAQLGNFNASGGVITIANTLDNTGNNLALSGGASALTLQGTLKGGTLSNAAGLSLSSVTFEGLTLATNLSLTDDVLTTTSGLTLAGSTLTITETLIAGITLTNSQAFAGTGHIQFDGTTSTGPSIGGNFTLTLGPTIRFATGATHAAVSPGTLINQGVISHSTAVRTLTLGSTTLNNAGTITVQNGGLTISGLFVNSGLLSATNGGTALLSSNLTRAQLGVFDATGGTIRIAGILDNSGNDLALTGGANRLTIEGGIKGGAISDVTGLTLVSASFDAVALNTNLTVSADTLTLLTGLTLNSSTLTLTESTGTTALSLGSNAAILGSGAILLTGTATPAVGGAFTLTLGSGISVVSSAATTFSPTGLINNGRISADASNRTLTLGSTSFLNNGTLTAATGATINVTGTLTNLGLLQAFGGTIRITNSTTANLGNFDATGGSLVVSTLLDNTGATLTLTGGPKTLSVPGTLKGGVIADTTGLSLSSTTFDGVTLATNLTLTDQTLTILNGFTLANATLTLSESATAAISFAASQTISGTGTILFDGPSVTGPAISGGFTATVAQGIHVRTGTGNGVINPTTFVNNGVISAQGAGRTLTISAAAVTNNGTFEARNGGVLVLNNPLLTIAGTFHAASGGTLRFLGGNLALTSPISLADGTASFGATSTSALAISGPGSVVVDAARTLTSDGVNVSHWIINGTHTLRFSPSNSSASAPGTLTIAKAGTAYTGRLNLTNAKLVIDTANPIDKTDKKAELFAAITSGAAGGAWTGPGINSSTAAADAAHFAVQLYDNADLGLTTFGGLPVDADSLLLTVVAVADATLDGKVDAFDLNILAAHWQQQLGAAASSGDFTRDGKVDAFDLNLLASNWQFGTAGSVLPSFAAALEAAGLPSAATLPEPATLFALGLPALVALVKRKPRPG